MVICLFCYCLFVAVFKEKCDASWMMEWILSCGTCGDRFCQDSEWVWDFGSYAGLEADRTDVMEIPKATK